ncbi:MAG: nucleotidyl transferase AbiEii/AbiGii toxin family protein, partial [Betaproteobacteria bacterium]|nr:nucleotidyl transferase AbiEii/AbiGii toxin family protein [Betaproteobacteria bacterium]
MAESWFKLGRNDKGEALEVATSALGRPAHLLEKDIWVVWILDAIYQSTLGDALTFKGGTS